MVFVRSKSILWGWKITNIQMRSMFCLLVRSLLKKNLNSHFRLCKLFLREFRYLLSCFQFHLFMCHLIPCYIFSICSKEISQCVILEALLSTSFIFDVTKQLVKWESSFPSEELDKTRREFREGDVFSPSSQFHGVLAASGSVWERVTFLFGIGVGCCQ